jgi:carbonic anhydrase
MRADKKLLLANKAWAEGKTNLRKDYFERVDRGQKPEFLWIGSSDSRVPAEEITGVEPGELLVHRNVGNLVQHTDLNILSVLKYAVEVHEVSHIIICGHYGCGGIEAAFSSKDYGLLNKWLYSIKDTQRRHRDVIEALPDQESKLKKLVELNVIEQVTQLSHTSIIQRAWELKNSPYIHGWVYDPCKGILRDLITFEPGTAIDPIYKYEINREEEM